MKHEIKSLVSRVAALLVTVGFVVLVTTAPAYADGRAEIHGKTYGEWSSAWWQWQELNFPDFDFGVGPVDCSQGQSGPVWFLAGTGGGAADRRCQKQVPAGTHLFFPLINANIWNDPPPAEPVSVEEKRVIMDGLFSEDPPGLFNSFACDLHSTLDGVPTVFSLPTARTQSPPFEYSGDPETVSDGFWVMLDPLPIDDHVVHFTGAFCKLTSGKVIFGVEATYVLNVK